ncbi:NAD-dependent epimerase/dehydratase family protein [Psychromonas aquatilis]|uniref:NAD-dependent epimerase/dehydratase family protein n=1 Tax=Psychromonas aquatilis TaxID=2005072 RepID=A0ABU9GMP9_9GAMM
MSKLNPTNVLHSNDLLAQQRDALNVLSEHTKCVFVTGAGGFLGTALCRFLRAVEIEVIGFSRSYYPHLERLGVTQVQGDLKDVTALTKAMKGADLVFHVASKAGVWGTKQSYFDANVTGANNVITACEENKVKKLIYTSTPSVTFDGTDESGINETQPYAKKFLNYYGLSKAIAEQHILSANSQSLQTVALRPHLIWGPGDQHLIPRVISRAKAGKLKLVGKTDKLVDTIYIDNAVHAHILAANELFHDKPKCAGKAYFLSNDQPILMADMLNQILATQNLPPVTVRVPSTIAYIAGGLLECWYGITRKTDEPIMTRFVAKQLSTSHYFDISAARQDFGYQPLISIEQGMQFLSEQK